MVTHQKKVYYKLLIWHIIQEEGGGGLRLLWTFCQTPVLGLELGVDFTFAGDNHKNHKNENDNPHLNFVKGTVLGDKEQGVGIRDKG